MPSIFGEKVLTVGRTWRIIKTSRGPGTEAERKAKERQKENQQESRPIVLCDGEPLKNCYLFKYLGSMFAADGSDELDVRRRIGIAQSRLG